MFNVLMFSIIALAQTQSAHVHGAGKVSLAFDGKNGKIEIQAPAESIYGFEHSARSAKDKKRKDDGLRKLEEKISEMVSFDESLKCEIKKEIFEVIEKKNHSEVEAEYTVTCEAPAAGSLITFNFHKVFPRLKKVHVEALVDQVQKSLDVNKDGETLELK